MESILILLLATQLSADTCWRRRADLGFLGSSRSCGTSPCRLSRSGSDKSGTERDSSQPPDSLVSCSPDGDTR